MRFSVGSRPKSAGFTLIELLVVIGIISILAGMLLPAAFHALDRAKVVRSEVLVSGLSLAVGLYQEERGFLPTMRMGELMSVDEQHTCLYLHLNDDRSDGHGTDHAFYDFDDDEVVGGRRLVPGQGAEPATDLPLGTVVDSWGGGVRYRELRSLPADSKPADALNPGSFDIDCPGADGVLGTGDDIRR